MTRQHSFRVLDVGQCDLDHSNITRLLKQHLEVTVDRAKSSEQVQYMLGFYDYDLVLVNRVFDADGAEGMALIELLKSADETRDIPIMLVSNYPEAQQAARAAGALDGFGKAQLEESETIARIKAALAAD